jgi:hypothetical protein
VEEEGEGEGMGWADGPRDEDEDEGRHESLVDAARTPRGRKAASVCTFTASSSQLGAPAVEHAASAARAATEAVPAPSAAKGRFLPYVRVVASIFTDASADHTLQLTEGPSAGARGWARA